jgi:GNAT superfamily N-acetyltransferase
MRSRHIEMPIAEFRRLPRMPGWEYEYFGGKAHITPSCILVDAVLRVTPRAVDAGIPMEEVGPGDAADLTRAFVEAFSDTIEYCDWPPDRIARSAGEFICDYFAGAHGPRLQESRLVREGGKIVGAALIVEEWRGPLLDLLMVLPGRRRRGLARAMVASACNGLRERGVAILRSRYHPGNEESAAWHRSFGFVDEPGR